MTAARSNPTTPRAPAVLSPEELEFFRQSGYVRIPQAFPHEAALALQDELWTELSEEHGIEREDRSTWRPPPRSPQRAKYSALNEAVTTERYIGAIDDLLGYDTWPRPSNWGGFLVNFPQDDADERDANRSTAGATPIPTDLWHWDGSPSERGLLVFSFFAPIVPGGGGTFILEGSHRLIDDFYSSLSPAERALPHKAHRKMFRRFDPWLEALTGCSKDEIQDRPAMFAQQTSMVRGVPCRAIELTGEPGDAVFCNVGMLHAASPIQTNTPRVMRVKFLFFDR